METVNHIWGLLLTVSSYTVRARTCMHACFAFNTCIYTCLLHFAFCVPPMNRIGAQMLIVVVVLAALQLSGTNGEKCQPDSGKTGSLFFLHFHPPSNFCSSRKLVHVCTSKTVYHFCVFAIALPLQR